MEPSAIRSTPTALKRTECAGVIRVHDTRHMSIFNERACAGCRVHVWAMAHAVFRGDGGLHDGGMGEADAVRCGAGSGDVRYAFGWGMVPAPSTGAGLPPLPPGAGGRGARGSRLPKAVGAAGRLGTTRALGLRVDSVISYHTIRHTDSREQDTSVTRASFTRTLVTAPPPGTRWANGIYGRNRRAGRGFQPRSRRSVRRGERSPGRRAADPAHVRTAAAPHGDEPTENETSENGRTVAARDRRSRRSALAARSHRHEPDVGRAARHATDASCERAA